MRKRWMAAMIGASALALGTAASQAQKPGPRSQDPSYLPGDPAPAPAESKRWRSRVDPPVKPASESVPGLPDSVNPLPEARPSPATEDPTTTVDAFLQRSRKEADDSIEALTREAEALRVRLARVEAALGRWRAVSAALNAEAKPAPTATTIAPDPNGPLTIPPPSAPTLPPGPPPAGPSEPVPALPEATRPG